MIGNNRSLISIAPNQKYVLITGPYINTMMDVRDIQNAINNFLFDRIYGVNTDSVPALRERMFIN